MLKRESVKREGKKDMDNELFMRIRESLLQSRASPPPPLKIKQKALNGKKSHEPSGQMKKTKSSASLLAKAANSSH